MEKRFQCERHPGTRLVPVGMTRTGRLRLLCARCSSVIVAGRGVVVEVDYLTGFGKISPDGGGDPLVFRIEGGCGRSLGQRVGFEYGVAGAEGTYLHAAMQVRPL